VQLNLRQAIIKRIERMSIEQLNQTIDDAIDGEERVLPGLGVILEMCWKESSDELKKEFIETLHRQFMITKA
jgi:small acid-soluble spore protein I (minor)